MNQEAQPIATLRNQMDEGNHAVNVSAATINQSKEVTCFLQIVPVSIQSGGNRVTTYAFLDSGSTVNIIDQSVQEKLRAQGVDMTLNIAGIHGTKDLKTEKVPLKKRDYNQRRIQSKPLRTRQFPWGTQTTATTRWSTASVTWVFYPTKASTWWKSASSLVKILISYNAHWTTREKHEVNFPPF